MTDLTVRYSIMAPTESEVSKVVSSGDTQRLYENFGHYWLEGRRIAGRQEEGGAEGVGLFFIHGSCSDYSKLDPIVLPLKEVGFGSVSFNLSGHNDVSRVPLSQTSLNRNLTEAFRFFTQLKSNNVTIVGHSLGGAIALKIAEARPHLVKRLILLEPALYPDAAYASPFGERFRRDISIPYAFLDSSSLEFLKRFTGKVLVIKGAFDGLKASDFGGHPGRSAGRVKVHANGAVRSVYSAIPFEVFEALRAAISRHRLEWIDLPDCDHGIPRWLKSNPEKAQQVIARLVSFISSGQARCATGTFG